MADGGSLRGSPSSFHGTRAFTIFTLQLFDSAQLVSPSQKRDGVSVIYMLICRKYMCVCVCVHLRMRERLGDREREGKRGRARVSLQNK